MPHIGTQFGAKLEIKTQGLTATKQGWATRIAKRYSDTQIAEQKDGILITGGIVPLQAIQSCLEIGMGIPKDQFTFTK